MSVIPEVAYEAVEKKLRQRDRLIRKAEEAVARARAKATDISAPSGNVTGGRGGLPGSRVERGALNVIRAEKRLMRSIPPKRYRADKAASRSPAAIPAAGTAPPQGSRTRCNWRVDSEINAVRQAQTLPTCTKVPTPQSPAMAPKTEKIFPSGRYRSPSPNGI